MRNVTCSLALGTVGFAFGSSAGLVVTALKAASAASRGSPGRRGRLVIAFPWHPLASRLIALSGTENEMAAIAKWRLLGFLAAAERDGEILRHGIAHRLGRGAAMRAVAIGLALAASAGAPHHEVARRQLGPEWPIGRHRWRSLNWRGWAWRAQAWRAQAWRAQAWQAQAWRDRRRPLADHSRTCRDHSVGSVRRGSPRRRWNTNIPRAPGRR